jgi:hypothetical protein
MTDLAGTSLEVSANTAPSPARAHYSNVLASVTGEDSTVFRFLMDSYGQTDPIFMFLRCGGTAENPTASVPSVAGGIAWYGFDGVNFTSNRGQVRGVFTGTWTPTSQPLRVYISTTAPGTIIEAERFSVWDDGRLRLINTPYNNGGVGVLAHGPDDFVSKGAVGTVEPTVTFAAPGDLSVAYGARVCRYSVVGDTVFVHCRMTFTPMYTTASGGLRISAPVTAAYPDEEAGTLRVCTSTAADGGWRVFMPAADKFGLMTIAGGSAIARGVADFPNGVAQTVAFSITYKRAL